jgi:hypothetical protein
LRQSLLRYLDDRTGAFRPAIACLVGPADQRSYRYLGPNPVTWAAQRSLTWRAEFPVLLLLTEAWIYDTTPDDPVLSDLVAGQTTLQDMVMAGNDQIATSLTAALFRAGDGLVGYAAMIVDDPPQWLPIGLDAAAGSMPDLVAAWGGR